MKKFLFLSFISLLLFSSSLFAASYYWVNGTGTWSDYAAHWATTSGGTVFHVTIPSPADDVYFDANSFITTGDTVYLDTTITNCRTMDWSGVINTPTLHVTGVNLQVYGSFILSPNMSCHVSGAMSLKSNSPGNMLDCRGIIMGTQQGYFTITFADSGIWDMQSALLLGSADHFGDVYLDKGTLRTHGYYVQCRNFVTSSNHNCALYLDTSTVICNEEWKFFGEFSNTILDADSAYIQAVQGSFYAGTGYTYHDIATQVDCRGTNCTFHDVTCSQVFSDTCIFHNVNCSAISGQQNTLNKVIMSANHCGFNGSHQLDSLILNNAGQDISVQAGSIVTINNFFLIQSDPGFPSSIEGNGGTATISIPVDTVCTDFIYLKNIAATGGAVYFAGDHSVDLVGNSGWNWTRCTPLISNVWPGDCNYDLVTDNFDLLNIGVSFGDTGYMRPAASLSYTAQPCQDWYYQFINAANVKHADCDGNGIVDANDSTAISLNYGLTHPARLSNQDETHTIGTELAFVLPPAIVPGTSVSVPITLGTSLDPAANVYGIAFTVNYDPAFIQPGTMSVTYSGSWVENGGNHLHLEKDFPGSGKTDIAFTRVDHIDASGYGLVATLNFIASPTANGSFNLSFSHVLVISHNEIEIPIQAGSGTSWVNVEEAGNQIASAVYPNPMTSQSQVVFSNPGHEAWTLDLKDVTGRIVNRELKTSGNSFQVERKNLGSGIYFYELRNTAGKTEKGKIMID